MSNNPQGAQINLKLALEKAALAESRKGVADLTKDFYAQKVAIKETGEASDHVLAHLEQQLKKAVQENIELEKSFKATDAAAKQLNTTTSVGLNNLKQVGGALSQLGLGGTVSQIGAAGEVLANVGQAAEAAGVSITATEVAFAGMTVATGPLIIAVGAISAVFVAVAKVMSDNAERAKKAEEDRLEAEKQRVQFELDNVTEARSISKEELAQRIKDRKDQLDILKGEIADRNKVLESEPTWFKPGTALANNELEERRKNDVQIQDLITQYNNLTAALNNDEKALKPLVEAHTEDAEAAKKATEARESAIAAEDALTQRRIENAKLGRTATEEQVRDMIEGIRDQIFEKSDELNRLTVGEKSEEATKRIEELRTEIAELSAQSRDLGQNVIPLVIANDKLIQSEKDAKQAADDLAKQNEKLADSYTKFNEDVAQIEQSGLDARKEIDSKYADEVAKIEEDGQLKRADIARDYADKLIDIARQAAQAAADELTRLEQKYKDNETGLGRGLADAAAKAQQDEAKIRIDAQREEARNLLEHQRNLEDIRRSAYADDTKNLLDRNFLALLNSREGAARSIEDENRRFARQGQDSGTDVQQRLQDAQQAAAQERASRLLAYQRANEDARLQYSRALQQQAINQQRQIEQAAEAQQRALQDQQRAEQQARRQAQQGYAQELQALSQKITRELQLRQQGYQRELQLLLQSEQLRQQTIAQAAAAARRYATPAQGAGGGSKYAASGGQIIVNDGGRQESYNGVPFPPVLGSFTPFRSGTIDPGKSTTNTFYITSHDPAGVRREVIDIMKQVIR